MLRILIDVFLIIIIINAVVQLLLDLQMLLTNYSCLHKLSCQHCPAGFEFSQTQYSQLYSQCHHRHCVASMSISNIHSGL
jgi:hypothetical protein